ncbi:phage holin family protein [Demequina sp.]|uniref:phage holin family protein n=1 Tax=Demequina sp. TaxID=2050685 RepID=UPI003D145833
MSMTGILKSVFNALFASLLGPLVARIQTEYAIAKVEMQVKLRELRAGAVMLAVAAFLGFFMIAILLTAAVLGLATIMPAWAAALVVAGALLLWVLLFGIWGMVKIRKNKDLVPHRAIENIKGALP